MSANSEYLPPPQSTADFESLCLDLWREIWGDPNAQKIGRSGQAQAGIDISGMHATRRVGIQCKQTQKALSAKVLKAEVAKAKAFDPPLDDFILATTAPRDEAIQKVARNVVVNFTVTVWSWDDIWHELYQRPGLMARIKGVYWPRLGALREPKIAASRLPRAVAELFGRETELGLLRDAWKSREVRVLTLVAWGGAGKTSLVAKFAAEMSQVDFDGADYFDWSFYSQGTREHSGASADAFVDEALRFFGAGEVAASNLGAWEKGAKLAEILGQRRSLLILDGLEPLQHSVRSPVKGQLKDPAVHALLRGLAAKNLGLCLVTTRVSPTDLDNWRQNAPQYPLARLSISAGIALLKSFGVHGSVEQMKLAVEEVKGHALTLNLLGSFLRDAHEGDVRRRDRVDLGEADEESGDGHAFSVMAAYEKFFEAEGEKGERQLAILRLLGIFDRAASGECLEALRKEPAISGLTEPILGMKESAWTSSLRRLSEAGMIEEKDGQVDTHPLIREYFARRLQKRGDAWSRAHGRLFDFLKQSTEHRPDTLAGLQPLYQAVYHGCQAGDHGMALNVYEVRILRGTSNKGFYSKRHLGAFASDLAAISNFFETPWSRVVESLSLIHGSWLIAEAASCLTALGRLREAVGPMRASLDLSVRYGDWLGAASSASCLTDLELALGDTSAAATYAGQSVEAADSSGDQFLRVALRSAVATVLHQTAKEEAALAVFREAESYQAEWEDTPLLYSLQGFRYCDLLLARAERAAWLGDHFPASDDWNRACSEVIERAAQTLTVAEAFGGDKLTLALDHLTLGRAWLYRAIWFGSAAARAEACAEIEKAVTGLRAAGQVIYLPWGLRTRSWLRAVSGDIEGARADLDEAQETAERSGMRLHLADIALYRARFFGDRQALAKARRLIDECGYGRRLPELEYLEANINSIATIQPS